MSKVNFKCPSCGHNLTVRSGVEIKSVDDIEGTTCTNCGRTIHKNDITKQARDHAEKLVRDMLGKHFK
ncbi:ECs_2282 family putative zinc-binding protein [Enterobacter roggenkampii]|uniref:ECs_2282 family putative zinc-binding protein n=1 Tax=Enterobacter cloacae complex TaxID=354276 RepID=UPI003C6CBA9D